MAMRVALEELPREWVIGSVRERVRERLHGLAAAGDTTAEYALAWVLDRGLDKLILDAQRQMRSITTIRRGKKVRRVELPLFHALPDGGGKWVHRHECEITGAEYEALYTRKRRRHRKQTDELQAIAHRVLLCAQVGNDLPWGEVCRRLNLDPANIVIDMNRAANGG